MQAHAPGPTEYFPYYGKYVELVKTGDILATLAQQPSETVALLSGLTEEQGNFSYAPGKWSIKQMLGHVNDTERIFAYRALRISRNDKTPMPGFEQDDYVRDGPFEHCRLAGLIEEFESIRRATVLLFQQLNSDDWLRRGTASQREVSVRALAYIIAGHELHHRGVLKEKYAAVLQ
jgi:hypothetical protein